MKKNLSAKRGPLEGSQPPSQPEKVGWIRKYCGKGIFREIWRNRYVVIRGDQLYMSEKEAPNLIFLAVSPEEKESWINALNSAITRAKNRILDERGSTFHAQPIRSQTVFINYENKVDSAIPSNRRTAQCE
ncbi:pleckstrin homology domain-containing family O member 1 [Pelobates cultripes]|uniref:Pleckstrin homology domain-containing family O member 1 n=1 Tax=Pelobates cultripes TaxID=61616 RepID=A0AAD1THX7_PELCU|nr:pleckstrin homology domain-containing family O member 1 [Pelobates cultripes]